MNSNRLFPFCPPAANAVHLAGSHCVRLSAFSLFRLFSLLCLFGFSNAEAQSTQDASVELSAIVQADPPRITLNWRASGSATGYQVNRKLKDSASWGVVVGNLDTTATQYIDSTVAKGVSYEYRVQRQAANYTGYGYINAGIEVPAVHDRGVLILVVDQTFADSLAFEIARLIADLQGDGWKVVRHDVARTASVPSVKTLIKNTYNTAPSNTKALFLLGRIPVPYSGDIFPDGHPDHEGAWPADVYYAEMNSTWTDNAVNVIVASDPRHRNIPEDGKFDQSTLPSDVELQVGRVDFANMPAFPLSEQQLLKNYLDKDHAYRHKLFTAAYRGVVDDNFGYFSGETFASNGWKNIAPLVGIENVIADDYFLSMRDSSYLWSYGCGGGSYTGAGGIGSTSDFVASDLKSVFTMLFGSYFGDWDATNNFLRAPLAQGTTLTNAWGGRPHWMLHHMGLGENIGYGTKLSQNNNNLYFGSYGKRFVHIALMGDPTLRNDVVAPPGNLIVTNIGTYNQLTWSPSSDPVLGYHVYVKGEGDTDYVLLNETPHPDISLTDDCAPGSGLLTYMVRAVALQQSASGTYFNLSQGTTDTISYAGRPEVAAFASFELTGSDATFTNNSLNAISYSWDFGDGATSTEANPVHTYLDGYFNGSLIASNGCEADTFYFEVLLLTGVKDITDDPSIVISPNPTFNTITLHWTASSDETVDLKIFTPTGKKVFTKDAVPNDGEVSLSGWPAGMYILHIEREGVRSVKRIILL